MKNEKRQEAEKLYFETDLSKSEIADKVGVNRRTIMLWCREGNWEKLRNSARHLPSIVAEKCYHVLDRYLDGFLTEGGLSMLTFRPEHADAVNKLASAIKKIKNRSTVNETMEMFNFFLIGLRKHTPELADAIAPHLHEYIESRADRTSSDFLLEEFGKDHTLPFPPPDIDEAREDDADDRAFNAEIAKTNDLDLALKNWSTGDRTADTPSSPLAV